MPKIKEGQYVFFVSLTPAGVVTRKELYKDSTHMSASFPFEVPEQEMTFGLPAGNPRVIIVKFDVMDLLKDEVESFDIHNIEKAPELYARLSKVALIPNQEIIDAAEESAVNFLDVSGMDDWVYIDPKIEEIQKIDPRGKKHKILEEQAGFFRVDVKIKGGFRAWYKEDEISLKSYKK